MPDGCDAKRIATDLDVRRRRPPHLNANHVGVQPISNSEISHAECHERLPLRLEILIDRRHPGVADLQLRHADSMPVSPPSPGRITEPVLRDVCSSVRSGRGRSVSACRLRFPISRPIVGRSRRPPGPGPTAEVSRSASIDVPVAPRLGTTAVTDDAAMSTNRDDLLDLSGLAAADQRGELVAVGAVAFGARPVEVALHGAHRHR